MDAVQMRDLMEHYGKLRNSVEVCKRNIRRIKHTTFEAYVEEKTHRDTLGEKRLGGKYSSNPTELLGLYGRKQFDEEREYELRKEQRSLAVKQALLWQLTTLIEQLDEKEKELIVRRYVDGERVEEACKSLGISRATAFRRLEAGLVHMAELYRDLYERAA